MVASEARMRASLVTTPSRTGTLRSSRIRTRLLRRSASVMRTTFMQRAASARPRPRQRGIEHTVGEAPFVVVPGAHLDQRALDHLGERGVEDRGVCVVVEIDGYQRRIVVGEDSLERPAGRLAQRGVHLLDGGRESGV